jgi:hypothetical protein
MQRITSSEVGRKWARSAQLCYHRFDQAGADDQVVKLSVLSILCFLFVHHSICVSLSLKRKC